MGSNGIELINPQQQARNLQRLHDEEQSFLTKKSPSSQYDDFAERIHNNGYNSDEEESSGYEYPKNNSSDCAILCTAWSRLSCSARFLILAVVSTACVWGVYILGVDEGIRETFSVGYSDANNVISGKEANAHYHLLQHAFTPQLLHSTRVATKELIEVLHNYYGGEEQTKNMLMRSWQAGWELDVDLFLGEDEHANKDGFVEEDEDMIGHVEEENDVDSAIGIDDEEEESSTDDNANDNIDDSTDDENLTPKQKKKKKKRNKKKNKHHGDDSRELGKKAKTVKPLNDPAEMNAQEKERLHQSKRERVTKLITTMARALLNPNQSNFKIGTIGSSVAAGHDNCHYDSYESQLERTLQSVFEAAGMNLIVQNAGEGGGCGDSHENQVFCITHNVSPNVDIIHYSWTYFEKGGAEVQRESLIRWGQRMQHRPMVHHYVAKGDANSCKEDNLENIRLDDVYAKYGYNAFCIKTALYAGDHDYDLDEQMGINRFGWKHVGDGYHNTTRYGELLLDDDPRKESLGTVYRNWHPGPLGHQIAADAFAYVYAHGVLMALDIIEADMNSGLNILDRWFDSQHRRTTEQERDLEQRSLFQLPPITDMNEPLYCHPLICSTSVPPSCLNYEKPTFGTAGIVVKDQAGWEIWHEDNKWNNMVGKVDSAIFKAKNDPEWFKKCTHLDACGGIFASEASHGELVFELPSSKMESGVIGVCGCCGKKVGDSMFLSNAKLIIRLNGRVLDKSKMEVWPNHKCVRVFGEDGIVKEEPMLLSFEVIGDNVEEATEVKISHVFAL